MFYLADPTAAPFVEGPGGSGFWGKGRGGVSVGR